MNESSEEIYFFVLVGNAILICLIGFVFYFVFQYNKRKSESIRENQRLQENFKQTLFQTQLEIQEQTLKNISQEIHDNIGQALTLVKLNLNTMLPAGPQLLEAKILNSKELVSKAITDLRDLSRSLDTDYVQEMGLQRAIEYELERVAKAGTIETFMEVRGSLFRLGKQKELILFRIVQETFNNTIKHAEAQTIKVFIEYLPDSLKLIIEDNGKGFDLLSQETGLGIRNMRNRSELIGYQFAISSEPGYGTTIQISLANG